MTDRRRLQLVDQGGLFRCCLASLEEAFRPDASAGDSHVCAHCDERLVLVEHEGQLIWRAEWKVNPEHPEASCSP